MERLEKSFWEKESKEHVQSSELKLDAKDIKARNAMLQKKVCIFKVQDPMFLSSAVTTFFSAIDCTASRAFSALSLQPNIAQEPTMLRALPADT